MNGCSNNSSSRGWTTWNSALWLEQGTFAWWCHCPITQERMGSHLKQRLRHQRPFPIVLSPRQASRQWAIWIISIHFLEKFCLSWSGGMATTSIQTTQQVPVKLIIPTLDVMVEDSNSDLKKFQIKFPICYICTATSGICFVLYINWILLEKYREADWQLLIQLISQQIWEQDII